MSPTSLPPSRLTDGAYMTLIAAMPRKRFGRWVRRLAGWEGSTAVSRMAVRAFVSRFGIDMGEAEHDIDAYPNVHALFTRHLKPGVRPIDPDPASVVSPVDGVVSQWGPVVAGRLTQIKDQTFGLVELLGGEDEARPFQGGDFLTIYLSPRHYHRIHSPVPGLVRRFDHVPGELYPVNGPSVRSVPELFAINERVISYVEVSPGVEVAVIKVGAVGVGRISLAYADRVSNLPDQDRLRGTVNPPYPVEKGGELGAFELGSTVVLVFPPGFVQLGALVEGAEIKMGAPIGRRPTIR